VPNFTSLCSLTTVDIGFKATTSSYWWMCPFPFNVTRERGSVLGGASGEFQLYRVFNFGPDVRLYMLPGAISGSCQLDATQYRAFVQGSGQA
jgi:hypothetical protein